MSGARKKGLDDDGGGGLGIDGGGRWAVIVFELADINTLDWRHAAVDIAVIAGGGAVALALC
jgi:hypothetical protein